jgi:ATP-dependent protease HslVU (ClpYQ) ATPase subunit
LNWNPVLSGAESRKARDVFDVNVGCDRVAGVGWADWLFYAPDRQGSSVDIDQNFVTKKLEGILKDEDLTRFIL